MLQNPGHRNRSFSRCHKMGRSSGRQGERELPRPGHRQRLRLRTGPEVRPHQGIDD